MDQERQEALQRLGADLNQIHSNTEDSQISQLDQELISYLKQGKKIHAIKIHREATNASLIDSKIYVEKIQEQYCQPPTTSTNPVEVVKGSTSSTKILAYIILVVVVLLVWVILF